MATMQGMAVNKILVVVFMATPFVLPLILFTVFILNLVVFFRYKHNNLSLVAVSWLNTLTTLLLRFGFVITLIKFGAGYLNTKPLNMDQVMSNLPPFILGSVGGMGNNLMFVYNNLLGDALLLLCFFVSAICIWHLGDRGLATNHAAVTYFSFFLLATSIMVSTTNLLVMFIGFELIFLPGLYFVYLLGYSKKVDRSIWILFTWTLFGAFIVLLAFASLYRITGTFDFYKIYTSNFTLSEYRLLYAMFFVGFGMKIPVFPFHYWLTQVHVEAPAGFSMFLSGFLVKTAWYCFYFIDTIFSTAYVKPFFAVWVSFCIVEASIKMWTQTDIKKAVAFATIQEMNLLLLGTLLFSVTHVKILVVFMLMHGVLSTLMFFLVDLIQKRTGTRNLLELQGAVSTYPNLMCGIWGMLIFFLGLPFTVKFIIEFHIALVILEVFGSLGCVIFFFCMFFGAVGFIKCWLLIIYGTPKTERDSGSDLKPEESKLIVTLLIILALLMFLTS